MKEQTTLKTANDTLELLGPEILSTLAAIAANLRELSNSERVEPLARELREIDASIHNNLSYWFNKPSGDIAPFQQMITDALTDALDGIDWEDLGERFGRGFKKAVSQ